MCELSLVPLQCATVKLLNIISKIFRDEAFVARSLPMDCWSEALLV